jgi:hypothetical protein
VLYKKGIGRKSGEGGEFITGRKMCEAAVERGAMAWSRTSLLLDELLLLLENS